MAQKIKYLIIAFVFVIFTCSAYSEPLAQNGLGTTTLKAGISLEDNVPEILFGTWRVVSNLTETNSPAKFKKQGVDLWNLERENSVIKLSNPFSGANAQISLEYVNGNKIRFTKNGDYDNKKLTDIVEIELRGDTFTGKNTLLLKTISDVDNSVIKTESACYNLRGEKISGLSVLGK